MESGIYKIDMVKADDEAGFWMCGEDASGNGVVTHYSRGKAEVIAPLEFRNRS